MLWWGQPQSLGDEAPASHRPLGTILTLVLRVKEGELRFVGGEVFLFWGSTDTWVVAGLRGSGGRGSCLGAWPSEVPSGGEGALTEAGGSRELGCVGWE